MKKIIVFLVILAWLGSSSVHAGAGGELITLINRQRNSAGLPSLEPSSLLTVAAQNKANEMMAQGYFSHTAPDGSSPWVFISRVGYRYSYAGENLARGFNSNPGVVGGWMDSPSHRANLLSRDYTQAGFGSARGVMRGVSTTVVVGFFAAPYGSEPTKPAAPRPHSTPQPKALTPSPAATQPSPLPAAASPLASPLSPQLAGPAATPAVIANIPELAKQVKGVAPKSNRDRYIGLVRKLLRALLPRL